MRLVYLSPVPWASFAQRPHKFVEWFHARTKGEVLWIEPYPTRFPLLKDLRRIRTRKDQQQTSNPPWLRVIRPCALPIEPMPWSGMMNKVIWRGLLHEIEVFASKQSTLLAIGKPSALALAVLKRLKGCHSIYDAMDNFPAFYSGFSRLAMRWRERQLVRNVSTVLVSSTALMQRWSRIRTDVRLVQNGVDLSLLPTTKIIRTASNTKVFGYVGTIANWFDWGWVIALANARPSDVIRLIGPVFSPVPSALPPNIEMLPPCDHRTALVVMQDFDVGLIPFKKNKLTASVDPIKYYEYRALGMPVISTEFGEMALRGNEAGTYISHGVNDIKDLVEKALNCKSSYEAVQQFRISNSWEARFTDVGITIMQCDDAIAQP